LRVAVEAQRLVLFEDAVDGVAHTVFVVARLGFDGEGDRRLGQLHGRVGDGKALIRQGVAGERVFQLGHRAQIAGMQLGHGLQGLALRAAEVGQPLSRTAGEVLQRAVVFHHSGDDLEIGDTPRKGRPWS